VAVQWMGDATLFPSDGQATPLPPPVFKVMRDWPLH